MANLTQNQARELLLPLLREKGRNYRSTKPIYARAAKEGEMIKAAPGSTEEREASKGDYVCRNQAGGEDYLVQGRHFNSLYEADPSETTSTSRDSLTRYNPKGQVVACQITTDLTADLSAKGVTLPFIMQNAAGNNVTLSLGDYVISPIGTTSEGGNPEVNGVSKAEFNSNYGG
jgi:hypothetical protein